ncbi:MAG: glycosyltransferase family 9 protein [Planctomycetota bacterium]|jgi:ADP-heptose:LPS heptosyltransferase
MQSSDDILRLLKEKGAEAARKGQCGLIVQPGAIGDCVLTLPLVAFMKDGLRLSTVDILGHTEYIGFMPGRTRVDGIRSMDSVELHRLFAETKTFDVADGDPLINVFHTYAWIVTFLGEPDSDFEQNLIFTANCSHSAEVISLGLKAPDKWAEHISDLHVEQLGAQYGLSLEHGRVLSEKPLIRPTDADLSRARELLRVRGLEPSEGLVVIHPGSGGPAKCWHLDNFLSVAGQLACRAMQVVFLLGPAEVERFSDQAIKNLAGVAECLTDLSLVDVVGLLGCAQSFIGNDSGITHLAGALGVRTIAVFGPTDPQLYRPIGPAVTVVSDNTELFGKASSEEMQKGVLEILGG